MLPEISVVIPVFEGENTIIPLVRRITQVLNGSISYEIVLVDDSGTARNSKAIGELIREYNSNLIKPVILTENTGQQNAIISGIRLARGENIITMDDDLQHPPEHIPAMIKKMHDDGNDVVYAYFRKFGNSYFRNFLGYVSRQINRIFFPGLYRYYSPFRLMKRDIALKSAELIGDYRFLDIVLPVVTSKIGHTFSEHGKSLRGSSSYSFRSLAMLSWSLYFSGKAR